MLDSIIIGAGPAGISAALYLLRAGFSVKVLYRDQGALSKAHKIENYYGFAEPLSGDALAANGMQGAAKLGADFLQTEVMAVTVAETGNHFLVQTAKGDFEARSVVLAAGGRRKAPNIQGLQEFTGKGVSYCAICDAFFYRGKKAAVLGNAAYALHEVKDLLPHAAKVYLLTDGQEIKADFPAEVEVYQQKITAIVGEGKVKGAEFADGSSLSFDGVFVALGSAGSGELARKAGIMLDEKNNIMINEKMATNVPGIFAAGDCTGGLLQVAKAVYEGAEAGLSAVAYLRRESN